MSRGPFLHAAKWRGFDGQVHFVACTCGERFTSGLIDPHARYPTHEAAIAYTERLFTEHRGVAAALEKETPQ